MIKNLNKVSNKDQDMEMRKLHVELMELKEKLSKCNDAAIKEEVEHAIKNS